MDWLIDKNEINDMCLCLWNYVEQTYSTQQQLIETEIQSINLLLILRILSHWNFRLSSAFRCDDICMEKS